MKKFIDSFLKKHIEKHYDVWGTKVETDLPPEFIITEHACDSLKKRFLCSPEKFHKVMLKAWETKSTPGDVYTKAAMKKHPKGIYKMFNGYIFVFRIRYNKRIGFAQKYLITVYKRNGFQIEY